MTRIKLLLILLPAFGWGTVACAQTSVPLPNYVPLLPQVLAKARHIDPQKGYLVEELKLDVYMITDGACESVFVSTGKRVDLFDAPPSFTGHVSQAVSETTSEPIAVWMKCRAAIVFMM